MRGSLINSGMHGSQTRADRLHIAEYFAKLDAKIQNRARIFPDPGEVVFPLVFPGEIMVNVGDRRNSGKYPEFLRK